MYFLKRFTSSLLVALAVLALTPNSIIAKERFIPTPSPTAEINSFELFWPISAGKTVGDSLFFVKNLKENIRGLLIFGMPQKARYSALLATKRVVEAEKLMFEGKEDLATKSLGLAEIKLNMIGSNFGKHLSSGKTIPDDISVEMVGNLNNLEIFLTWLPTKYPLHKEKLDKLLGIVKSLQEKI